MFRAIRNLVARETAGFEDTTDVIRDVYQESLPNMFFVRNEAEKKGLSGINAAMEVPNPLTRTVKNTFDIQAAAVPVQPPHDLINEINMCASATLDGLIESQPYDKPIRCGWLYKKGPAGPVINRGVLGTRNGPLYDTDTQGATYYWDLLSAQKNVLGDLCISLTNCSAVGDSRYAGQCAYDPRRGRGVPVFADGSIRWPDDPQHGGQPDRLIRSRAACPAPPAPGTPAFKLQQTQAKVDVCQPLPNGTYSRNCMREQVRIAGCNDKGALAMALSSSANLADYTAALRKTKAYEVYQQRAPVRLLEGALKDGSVALNLALDNFKALGNEARKGTIGGLQSAARDLCFEKGALDKFDFCSELTETTPAPYSVECAQKEWIKRGGVAAGALYPSAATMASYWNKFATWGLVRQEMDKLHIAAQKATYEGFTELAYASEGFTGSTSQEKQKDAMKKFYGIDREPIRQQRVPYIVGVETYWWNMTNNTFLGRVLVSDPAQTNLPLPLPNGADNIQVMIITNIRPAENMNVYVDTGAKGKMFITMDQNKNNKDCWYLRRGGPNVLTAYWTTQTNKTDLRLFYRDCAPGSTRTSFPSSALSLAAEPEGPFIDFHYKGDRLVERRLPMEARATGGSQADSGRTAVRLGRNGAITLMTPIAVNAWRTLTVHAVCYAVPTDRQQLLAYGSLFQMYVDGEKTYMKFTGPNLTRTIEWPTKYEQGQTYVIYINMRSAFDGQYPDILSVAVITQARAQSGSDIPSIVLRTQKGEPLYNVSDSHNLSLGTTGGISADFGIRRVRFYDYELRAGELKRDVEDTWLREDM
jgi:hypothetical protein